MSEIKYNNILEVNDLYTSFNIPAGEVRSVNGVSFALKPGRVLGIVGESGSGKSVTAYSIMQILQNPGRIVSGSIRFKGKELVGLPDAQLEKIRGEKISIIFQDPMSSLNPVYTIGNQIMEAIRLHPNAKVMAEFEESIGAAKEAYNEAKRLAKIKPTPKNKAKIKEMKDKYQHILAAKANYPHDRALEMLKLVGINEPEKRLKQYPFEFSGGMLQRIMIAMSLVCEPDLLIADEPTTALDVTIQAQILELLKSIQKKMGMAIIIITHDLGVVAQICDEIDVMYAGRIVERGTAEEIFYDPQHEYTKGLIKSIPQVQTKDKLIPIEGNPVDVFCLPKGCSFAPRCSSCMKICLNKYPTRVAITEHHSTSCFKYVIEAYKKGELTQQQLKRILYYSNTGTASFKPVSRLDIYDAFSDYSIAEQQYKTNKKNPNVKKEEIEKLEFKMKEAKTNYKRAKNDFRISERNRVFARKERPSTERGDMAKKIKDAKKLIRYYKDEKVNKHSLYEYISNLSITSFPVDLYYNDENVRIAEEKYEDVKDKIKYSNEKDKLSKIQLLTQLDNARRNYEDAVDKLARARRVNFHLLRTKSQLIKINTRRVKRVIKENFKNGITEFKKHRMVLNDQELKNYFDNFYVANWDLNEHASLEDDRRLRRQFYREAAKIRRIRHHDDPREIRKSLKAFNDLQCAFLFNRGDISIGRYYKHSRPKFVLAIKQINAWNRYKRDLAKIKGGK